VLGARASARPARQAAAEQEGDVRLAKRGGGSLHRFQKLLERLGMLHGGYGIPVVDGAQARGRTAVRIAAAGDVHMRPGLEQRFGDALEELDSVEVVLLAGDLTATGEIDEGEALARACRRAPVPVVAVLGNHDWHAGHSADIAALLEDAGVHLLGRGTAAFRLERSSVGIAGTKGFVGGFRESRLPDFGEPLLRQVYAATGDEVRTLTRGLGEIADCAHRVVLLHYAPTASTLHGEREPIWTFLGSERLAGPIVRHRPDLVLHGHAHAGLFEGRIGAVPVFNVAWPLIGGGFAIWSLGAPDGPSSPTLTATAAAASARP
jgi:Icc-related predicted phosphoesterase